MAKRSRKSAYDGAHVKRVTAWALLFNGKPAGKIVANWGNDGMSGVLMTVNAYAGQMHTWCDGESYSVFYGAGSFGADKMSGAFDAILDMMPGAPALKRDGGTRPDLAGLGSSEVRRYLESVGYDVFEVLS